MTETTNPFGLEPRTLSAEERARVDEARSFFRRWVARMLADKVPEDELDVLDLYSNLLSDTAILDALNADPEQDIIPDRLGEAYDALMPFFQKYNGMLFPSSGNIDPVPDDVEF